MKLLVYSRLAAFAVATAVLAAIPAVAHVVLLGAERPSRRVAVRCCQMWCLCGCLLLGVRRTVHGRPPRGVFLAASNHLSYLDILVLGSLYPGVFVAKREISRWSLFGYAARLAGTVFVDRESPRDIVRVVPKIAGVLRKGSALTLFPEGRITTGASVLPFMPSLLAPAAEMAVPSYAISVSYSTTEPDVEPSSDICWPNDKPLFAHMRRVAGMRDLEATVFIHTDPVVSRDRKQLAKTLHDRVCSRFEPIPQPEEEVPCAR